MSRNTSIGVLVATLVCVAVAVWWLSRPDEGDVYLAGLDYYANASAVLTSEPSTCGIKPGPVEGLPEALVSSFLMANGPGAGPVSLSKLDGHAAIADAAALKRFRSLDVSPSVLLREQRHLVSLSRIGFNSTRTEALFCAQGEDGILIHVRLQDGHWQFVDEVSAWVT